MLNSAPEALVKHTKKEIKDKFNIEKITFYTFKILST
jgi:hypothetical protein